MEASIGLRKALKRSINLKLTKTKAKLIDVPGKEVGEVNDFIFC